jgi:hypothetical protein
LHYGSPSRMARKLGEILRERIAAGVRIASLYDAFGTADVRSDEVEALCRPACRCSRSGPSGCLHASSRSTDRTFGRSSSIAGYAGRTGSGLMGKVAPMIAERGGCSHIEAVETVRPPAARVCDDCVKMGSR